MLEPSLILNRDAWAQSKNTSAKQSAGEWGEVGGGLGGRERGTGAPGLIREVG